MEVPAVLKRFWVLLALLFHAALAMAALDVNVASVEDLETIKGIGPVLSEKIVTARQQQRFSNWEDLIERVRGVGPKSAERLSDGGLTVNGQSYVPKAQSPSRKRRANQARR